MRPGEDGPRGRPEREKHLMRRINRLRPALAVAASFVASLTIVPAAQGIALEAWGNEPIPAANYADWPNIMPVVNHRSRVYRKMVNADEWFYYRGDADALNAALRSFARVGGEKRVVVLRPSPGEAHSLDGQRVPHDWSLHLRAGITRVEGDREQYGPPWDVWPTITIHVRGAVELDKVELPPGVTVLRPTDLIERLRVQLKDAKATSRGEAVVELAGVDPYSAPDAQAAAAMLDTDDDWMLQMAAIALSRYGHRAKFALPKLRPHLNHEKPYVRQRIAITIETIENAGDDAEAAKAHREAVDRIDAFVRRRKDAAP